jgi:hypothetical protein
MQIFTEIHVMDSAASGLAQYMYTGETQLLRWLALFLQLQSFKNASGLYFLPRGAKRYLVTVGHVFVAESCRPGNP